MTTDKSSNLLYSEELYPFSWKRPALTNVVFRRLLDDLMAKFNQLKNHEEIKGNYIMAPLQPTSRPTARSVWRTTFMVTTIWRLCLSQWRGCGGRGCGQWATEWSSLWVCVRIFITSSMTFCPTWRRRSRWRGGAWGRGGGGRREQVGKKSR